MTISSITSYQSYVLDIISDPYGVDVLVNECLESGIFSKKVYVKVSGKNVLNKTTLNTLQELNHLFNHLKVVSIYRRKKLYRRIIPLLKSRLLY